MVRRRPSGPEGLKSGSAGMLSAKSVSIQRVWTSSPVSVVKAAV